MAHVCFYVCCGWLCGVIIDITIFISRGFLSINWPANSISMCAGISIDNHSNNHPQPAYNQPTTTPQPTHNHTTTTPQPLHNHSTTTPQPTHNHSTTTPQPLTTSLQPAHNQPTTSPQPAHNHSTTTPQPPHNHSTTTPLKKKNIKHTLIWPWPCLLVHISALFSTRWLNTFGSCLDNAITFTHRLWRGNSIIRFQS